jgi:predicted nucleotidyltransferase
MGMMHSSNGLAAALFSKVQLRVLGLLFGQPERRFYSAEIIRLAGVGTGAVQRELQKLSRAGIISVEIAGNRKLYRANAASPIFQELQRLILKTVGLIEPLAGALRKFRNSIKIAFVYGSVAKGADTAKSDVDLMIVGNDLGYSEIFSALQKAEKVLSRPVNPTLMTAAEWSKRHADKNSFASKIAQQPKLFVFGSENELARIG